MKTIKETLLKSDYLLHKKSKIDPTKYLDESYAFTCPHCKKQYSKDTLEYECVIYQSHGYGPASKVKCSCGLEIHAVGDNFYCTLELVEDEK